MNEPRFHVTTLGEGQLRLSVPNGVRLEDARNFEVHVSGTEANVTGLLARLGWSCGWVSRLPNSPLGARVRNEYQRTGLDLSAVRLLDDTRLATYYVENAVPPRSTQVYYDRANTCFSTMRTEDVDWDYLLDSRVLHLSGLSLGLSASVRELMLEAIKRAKTAGIKVSFDVNYRAKMWSAAAAALALKPVLEQVDILFCGQRDASRLFGLQGSPGEIMADLRDLTSAQHIVMTLGNEGLVAWDGKTHHRVAAREVTVLDRIGAGDACVGGVLHGYLQGDFEKGLRYGVACAALALSQYGDQTITNVQELERLLEGCGHDIER